MNKRIRLGEKYETQTNPYQYTYDSKYNLRPYKHMDIEYITAYDMLGLSLSLCGPAPHGATDQNFFLPMTFLYSQWCQKVASTKAEGVGNFQGVAKPPSVYQCTWLVHLTNNDPPEYFFGASLSGYSTKNPKGKINAIASKKAVGVRWEQLVQESRYRVLPRPILLPNYGTVDMSPLREIHQEGTRLDIAQRHTRS